MKKNLFKNISMLLLVLICSFIGVDVSMATTLSPGLDLPTDAAKTGAFEGENGGLHTNAEQSVSRSLDMGDDILLTTFDKEVVKILPYKTPIDTLFRYATHRKADSMQVKWVSVDIPGCSTTVSATHTKSVTPTVADDTCVTLVVVNPDIYTVGQTILVPTVMGFTSAGVAETETPLMLFVKAKAGSNLTVMAVNGGVIANTSADQYRYVPTLTAGIELIGMGPAANEYDVQWTPESAYLTAEENYLQCFKCQVEESYWYERSAKNIDWEMDDQKEMAILNWKMKMERTFLLGIMGSVKDDTKKGKRTFFTNGIIRYIKKSFQYTHAGWTKEDFIRLAKMAFVGNSGSNRRILFVGSDLLAEMSMIDYTLTREITSSTKMYHGLEFNEVRTNFGKIMIMHHEMLDKCGWSEKGVLLDPDMLFKWVFEEQNSQKLDNKELGISNTKADVTTETSGPGIKNPDCHLVVSRGAAA